MCLSPLLYTLLPQRNHPSEPAKAPSVTYDSGGLGASDVPSNTSSPGPPETSGDPEEPIPTVSLLGSMTTMLCQALGEFECPVVSDPLLPPPSSESLDDSESPKGDEDENSSQEVHVGYSSQESGGQVGPRAMPRIWQASSMAGHSTFAFSLQLPPPLNLLKICTTDNAAVCESLTDIKMMLHAQPDS